MAERPLCSGHVVNLRHLADVLSGSLRQTARMPLSSWPADPARLRFEIHAMRDAILRGVDEFVPEAHLRGVYFKGSASKDWNTPCDYVPELSDLDLHLWFQEDVTEKYEAQFRESVFSLRFSGQVERGFLEQVPQPLHWPRPQILILNDALRRSPIWSRSHALVLRGEAYPGTDPTTLEDRETLLRVAREASGLGLDWMDKVGPQLWTALRSLNFRLSPLPARLLSAMGAGAWVWGQNRSTLIQELRIRGFANVADGLEDYYAHAWRGFQSGWTDPRPMRAALTSGLRALPLAASQVPHLTELEA